MVKDPVCGMQVRTRVLIFWSLLLGTLALSGCGMFRYTGYYSHSDAFPQLHYDWAKDPYLPSPQGQAPHLKLKFPTTVKEHREAAQTYLEKAKAYRVEAGIHREMRPFYEGNDGSMISQCDQIIKRFDEMADDMERFAKWHEEQEKKEAK